MEGYKEADIGNLMRMDGKSIGYSECLKFEIKFRKAQLFAHYYQ